MPPRYKPQCRFCPLPASGTVLRPTPSMQMTLAITSPGEGGRLWKHVLFGTSTCISMIEGYASLKMPGNPSEALVALRDRISKVLEQYEGPHGNLEDNRPAKPAAPDDKAQNQTLQG